MTTSGPVTEPAGSADPAPRGRFRFLLSPGWIGAIVGAIAFAVLCVTVLAPWQFGRHTQRDTQNSAVDIAMSSPAVPAQELLNGPVPAEHAFRLVTATGTFLPEQVAVRLRQNQAGQPASEILAALKLTDGTILLVDRGYVPTIGSGASESLPPLPAGQVTLTGRIQPYQPDPLNRPPVQRAGHTEVYGIDASGLPGIPASTLGGFIQLVPESPGVLTAIGVPHTDPGPFYSYAWQWLIFGAMGLFAVGYFIYREATDPREERDEPEFDRAELYDRPDERQ